jgi:osmotically-inducible protein OsmY
MTDGPALYQVEHLREALATDERTGELGLDIDVVEGKVFVRGAVATEERRKAVGEIAEKVLRGLEVVNETEVDELHESEKVENLP